MPSLDFYYDGEYKTWWEKWGRWILFGIGVLATIAAVIAAPFTCGASSPLAAIGATLLKIAIGTAIGTAVALATGGTIAGLQSMANGGGFWEAFADYASENFVDALVTSFALTAVTIAASNITKCFQCFKEGTLVDTENGLKPIEEIAVGDKVLAYDEQTGEQAYKPVLQLFQNTTKEWQYVYIEGETEPIISTPGHKYYLPENNVRREDTRALEHVSYVDLSEKWVSACDLKPGDKVLLSDGKYGIVEKTVCIQLSVPETTYNLEVADFHTYYVGNTSVLVHNNNCGMKNQVIFNKDINGYKNVRMDLEMGGSGKANLHIHVGKDKFIFNGTTYVNTRGQTVPNVIANSKTVSVGLEKATIYAKKLGWSFP